MTPRELKRLEKELTEYLDSLTEGLGRPERRRAMAWYVNGLLLDGERKSIQPMAARLVDSGDEVEAMRQRLQQCVVVSPWDDARVRARIARKIDDELPDVEALVIDDTGFPKKGKYSVGVARQYSGTLGRTENCQVATSLHLAGESGSACIGMQLYLPQEWTEDRKRSRKAGVPDDLKFQTKLEIAIGLLDEALAWGVRKHIMLADAGYGDSSEFRDAARERGLHYLTAISGNHTVWPPGSDPRPPKRKKRPGRPQTQHRDGNRRPRPIRQIAETLTYREVSWRDGSRAKQRSWFAAVRVYSAERRTKGRPPGDEQWLLCEWPKKKDGPSKFYFSSLPASTSISKLVRLAKLRWRVERDYQELKQEIGLDHYEGRTWRGFHHHATLCAAAHAFLALRRALFPPQPTRKLDPSSRPSRASAGSPPSNRGLPAVSPAL